MRKLLIFFAVFSLNQSLAQLKKSDSIRLEKLMKEMALANNGTWISGLPPRNSAADAEYIEKFPNYKVFVDALGVGTLVNHPAIFEIDKPLKLAFEKMMLEGMAVDAAMAELDVAGDEILARYNSTQK